MEHCSKCEDVVDAMKYGVLKCTNPSCPCHSPQEKELGNILAKAIDEHIVPGSTEPHWDTPTNQEGWKFKLGDNVYKIKGSQWSGTVVGFYSTELTPRGYCVESGIHKGSVQIYPETALALIN